MVNSLKIINSCFAVKTCVVVTYGDINLLACFFFKCSKLCGNIIMLLSNTLAVISNITRNKNKLNIVIFGTLIKEFINNKSAFVFHGCTAVCIPINFIINFAACRKLLFGNIVMKVRGYGKFQSFITFSCKCNRNA